MLYDEFLNANKRPMFKWAHYFPIYERHFNKFINRPLTILEIGVFKGGSLQLWKRYFGPFATIVGIDIDPECKNFEEKQIHIRTGDQSDIQFLRGILNEFGPPDIVIDDGSHVMEHICRTFNFLYDKISKNGIYLIEDLHTAYMDTHGGGLKREGTFIEKCKDMLDLINARHCKQLPNKFANSTYSMTFYDSVAVFEKMEWTQEMLRSEYSY